MKNIDLNDQQIQYTVDALELLKTSSYSKTLKVICDQIIDKLNEL